MQKCHVKDALIVGTARQAGLFTALKQLHRVIQCQGLWGEKTLMKWPLSCYRVPSGYLQLTVYSCVP